MRLAITVGKILVGWLRSWSTMSGFRYEILQMHVVRNCYLLVFCSLLDQVVWYLQGQGTSRVLMIYQEF